MKNSPEEAEKSVEILENVEEDSVWVEDEDALIENAQQEVSSISSNSSSIAVLAGEEEDDIHPSDLLHFNMILSKGIASCYQSVTEARASNKQPHKYIGDSCTSQWRVLKVAKRNGQTISNFFNPVVSMQT